jgi:hypothetical protein
MRSDTDEIRKGTSSRTTGGSNFYYPPGLASGGPFVQTVQIPGSSFTVRGSSGSVTGDRGGSGGHERSAD